VAAPHQLVKQQRRRRKCRERTKIQRLIEIITKQGHISKKTAMEVRLFHTKPTDSPLFTQTDV